MVDDDAIERFLGFVHAYTSRYPDGLGLLAENFASKVDPKMQSLIIFWADKFGFSLAYTREILVAYELWVEDEDDEFIEPYPRFDS